eukprot:GEMP01019203.1.p1 GENE.GEMP01019203.1~~GEMP01019203.1.p1  ORF type:complete len:791 (+),score=185.21 GEMP01019203.1:160-2532(+)
MSNWWNTIKDKGTQLKQGSQEAAKKAQELAKKTKEVAKNRLGRYSGADDLERSFEIKLATVRNATQLAELHRSWLIQIVQKDGSAFLDGDKHLQFRQVFLRSRALEASVELICREPHLRKEYVGDSTNPIDPIHHLFGLFKATLACPHPVWRALWRNIESQELFTEVHVKWIGNLLRVLKSDWQDEVYHAERTDLAVNAEALRAEIRNIKTGDPHLSDMEQERRHTRKVKASKDMVQLYRSLRQNMEEAVAHREKALARRNADLELLKSQMDSHKADLATTAVVKSQKSKNLQIELTTAASGISSQLESLENSAKDIDHRIAELEAKKKELRMQLEEVTQDLLTARHEQRKHMQEVDKTRDHLAGAKKEFHSKIQSEEENIATAESDRDLCEGIQKIIEKTEGEVAEALMKQITDLGQKRVQFDAHFVEVLKDHCRFEAARLAGVGAGARSAATVLQNVLQTMGENPDADDIISERHNFAKACTDVDAVWSDVLAFRKDHKEFMDQVAEELKKLGDTYRELKEVLAPGLALMQKLALDPKSPSRAPSRAEPHAEPSNTGRSTSDLTLPMESASASAELTTPTNLQPEAVAVVPATAIPVPQPQVPAPAATHPQAPAPVAPIPQSQVPASVAVAPPQPLKPAPGDVGALQQTQVAAPQAPAAQPLVTTTTPHPATTSQAAPVSSVASVPQAPLAAVVPKPAQVPLVTPPNPASKVTAPNVPVPGQPLVLPPPPKMPPLYSAQSAASTGETVVAGAPVAPAMPVAPVAPTMPVAPVAPAEKVEDEDDPFAIE